MTTGHSPTVRGNLGCPLLISNFGESTNTHAASSWQPGAGRRGDARTGLRARGPRSAARAVRLPRCGAATVARPRVCDRARSPSATVCGDALPRAPQHVCAHAGRRGCGAPRLRAGQSGGPATPPALVDGAAPGVQRPRRGARGGRWSSGAAQPGDRKHAREPKEHARTAGHEPRTQTLSPRLGLRTAVPGACSDGACSGNRPAAGGRLPQNVLHLVWRRHLRAQAGKQGLVPT